MNRQPFLVAVGDNCVDYYVQTRTGYPGGNPVNVSVYFTRTVMVRRVFEA